ncbi:MAG TPA: hypothetical protein V6C81_06290 [Planktothrix sp.]|jgi:hypothetical protein
MSTLTSESPVALEHLDDHLKAILKVKLREFVHLSPCFADIPSIDMSHYGRGQSSAPAQVDAGCPNSKHRVQTHRRRPTRPLVV